MAKDIFIVQVTDKSQVDKLTNLIHPDRHASSFMIGWKHRALQHGYIQIIVNQKGVDSMNYFSSAQGVKPLPFDKVVEILESS